MNGCNCNEFCKMTSKAKEKSSYVFCPCCGTTID
jgi:hypothetical protein